MKHFEIYALSEVYDIEPLTSGSYRYRVYYTDFGAQRMEAGYHQLEYRF